MSNHEEQPNIISETENFGVWVNEEEGEMMYHLELGDSLTIHFSSEEWEEFLVLVSSVGQDD